MNTKFTNLRQKINVYKKGAADGFTKKKQFSDMVNAFISSYTKPSKPNPELGK